MLDCQIHAICPKQDLTTCRDTLDIATSPIMNFNLYFFQHLLLELPLNLLTLLIRSFFTVEVEECTQVKLRCLQEFDFADVDLDRCQCNIMPRSIWSLTFCNG